MLEDENLRDVLTCGTSLPELRDVCTGDYYTVVRLSNGAQGAAINYCNVNGPWSRRHDFRTYDSFLLETARRDPLLYHTILSNPDLTEVDHSVKIALINALSVNTVMGLAYRAAAVGCRFDARPGYLDIGAMLVPGDVVGMIGCLGNYSCWRVAASDLVAKVFFSDLKYTGRYRAGIQDWVSEVFAERASVVELSDGRLNDDIVRTSSVLILTAEALGTRTFDTLLGLPTSAREVIVVGWSYSMDPRNLFQRGVTAVTMRLIAERDLVGLTRSALDAGRVGTTATGHRAYRVLHFVRSRASVARPVT